MKNELLSEIKTYVREIKIPGINQSLKNRIEESKNIIFAGNPGTGKTHISIGLGIAACNAGYKVLFTTEPLLINELKESRVKIDYALLKNS